MMAAMAARLECGPLACLWRLRTKVLNSRRIETGEKAMKGKLILCIAGMLATALAASAHHSFAATYDEGKTIEIKGKIVVFSFRNPHSFVTIEVTDASGKK